MENDSKPSFTIDIPSLKTCFEIYSNQQQNQANIREAESYLLQCRSDSNFPSILLQLFDDATQPDYVRFVALIQFKNLVTEIWKIRKPSKSMNLFPEEFKQQVRAFFVKCLDRTYDRRTTKQVNDILRLICLSDFPLQYKDLVDYFVGKVEYLSETIQDQHTLMGEETMSALRILKIVMTEKSPKRFGNLEEIFSNVYFKLIQGFHKFWDYFHTHLVSVIENSNNNNADQVAHFLKLARKADRIYLAFFVNGCEEMINNKNVVQVCTLISQRAMELVKIVHLLHSKKQHEEIYTALNKNLYKLLFSISEIQVIFPLLFKDVLSDYLELLEYIIANADVFANEYILRAAVICLTSVLRCYMYYGDDVYLLQKKKIEGFADIQKEAYEKYHNYFAQQKIETLIQLFLLNLLPRRPFLSNMQEIENFEDFVETEDEQIIDESEKLENSLYNLSLACLLSLMIQFPTVTIPIIHTLCLKVVKNEVELPSSGILDGLFSIIGLLPIAYKKKNIGPADYLDFEAVLAFLETNGKNDINLAKRIPVLIHKWIGLFDVRFKTEVIKLIVEVIKSINVYIVKYECCMCLKKAMETDIKLELDYVGISEQLVPVIVDQLHKYLNPQVVWGLIDFLKILFTKTQHVTQNSTIITQIQSLSIETLVKSDYEPLLTAVADLSKTIIATFPPGTQLQAIFQLALQFIDIQLDQKRNKYYVLSLWLFVAKEYNPVQGLDTEMKALFGKYLNVLLSKNNPYDLSVGLNIIEEYLLAGLIGADDYASVIGVLDDTYKKTLDVQQPTEEVFEVKSALLGVFSTLLLIYLESNSLQNLAVFENLLVFILKDIFNNYTGPSCQAFRVFKASTITLVNRFIIISLSSVVEIFQKYEINFYEYLDLWARSMNFLSSKPAIRLNTLAILQIVPEIGDKEAFQSLLRTLVRFTLPEVEEFSDGKAPNMQTQKHIPSIHERLRDVKDSERKRASRQTNLYFDLDIKKSFVTVFKQAVVKHGLTLDEIAYFINDEGYVKRFVHYIES